jgi:hypothetical protein
MEYIFTRKVSLYLVQFHEKDGTKLKFHSLKNEKDTEISECLELSSSEHFPSYV